MIETLLLPFRFEFMQNAMIIAKRNAALRSPRPSLMLRAARTTARTHMAARKTEPAAPIDAMGSSPVPVSRCVPGAASK